MKRFNLSITYLFCIYIVALCFLTIFRIVEFAYLFKMANIQNITPLKLLTPFVKGIWFDNVIVCSILILPIICLTINSFLKQYRLWPLKAISIWCSTFYSAALMISIFNIPYFKTFGRNLNSSIFNLSTYSVELPSKTTSFITFILVFILTITLFVYINVRLLSYFQKKFSFTTEQDIGKYIVYKIICSIGIIGLCIIGIRGTIGKYPIRSVQAYYSNNPFLNQLGINPTFALISSIKGEGKSDIQNFQLMDDAEAIAYAKSEYGISEKHSLPFAPLRRFVKSVGNENKKNVILILMEPISASMMKEFGQEKIITPTLDSLYSKSLAFSHFFATGVGQEKGISSVLFSLPTPMGANSSKRATIHSVMGLPSVLHEHGYYNLIFDFSASLDQHLNSFLCANCMDDMRKLNIPQQQDNRNIPNPLDSIIPILNNVSKDSTPFFVSILDNNKTVPHSFKSDTINEEENSAAYTDWCIKDFLEHASRQQWYENTYFILVGNRREKNIEDQFPAIQNHIPLLIFGKDIFPRVYDGLGMQVDIMPTLLGLLHLDYQIDGFGIDLLQRRRDKLFYCTNTQIIGRTHDQINCYTPSTGKSSCYILNEKKRTASSKSIKKEFEELKKYSTAMAQTALWMYYHN